MGSRAVVVLCRDEAAAQRRFGVVGKGMGIIYTRTGRRFFEDTALEQALLSRVRDAAERGGLWEDLRSDWMLLDCELMPWSVKAQELIRTQYATVGAAARAMLAPARAAVVAAHERGVDMGALPETLSDRTEMVEAYVAAYRRYCWPVNSLDDLQLAPFHLLAAEGEAYTGRNHRWHMERIAQLVAADGDLPILTLTRTREVMLGDAASEAAAIAWWESLTAGGGEGMVVKPLDFIATGTRGLIQPAIKCRGREYLRIIYGPEYTAPANLERLRQRGLGAKRSLALREFALGVEGLGRFIDGEPLRRVHECVFAVLALESEPVDPRL